MENLKVKALELLKSLKFLEAACYVAAALLAVFLPDYAVNSTILLAAVVAVLKVLGIEQENEVRKLLAERKAVVVKKVKGKK